MHKLGKGRFRKMLGGKSKVSIGVKAKGKIRIRGLTIGLLIVSGLLGGCQEGVEVMEIGVLGTMTGANSDLSISGRRGIEIAVNELNEAGGILGKKVELVLKDDTYNSDEALACLKEFQDQGINLVIGPYTSGMITSNIDAVTDMDLLVMGPTISADELSFRNDHFIRFIASTEEQAIVLVDEIEKMDLDSFLIISDSRNEGFTEALNRNFKMEMFVRLGIEVPSITLDPQDEDAVLDMMAQVKDMTPEGIFIIASAEDLATLAQKFYQCGIDTQLFGPLWANTPELLRKGGEAVNGIYVVGGIDPESTSEAFQAFRLEFEERYGEQPTFASRYSYETMMALAQSIELAGSTDPVDVKKTMLEIRSFQGLDDTFELDEYGDNTRAYLLFENVDGSLRKVDHED